MNLPVPVKDAKLPQTYQAARSALSKCEEIDECQEWADKAAALASYAKQAQDDQLGKMADRIHARAIRRCGELLKQIEAGRAGRPKKSMSAPTQISRSAAAKDAGLSERQKNTALRVASVPDEEFEAEVESAKPPTVTALAEKGKRKRKRPRSLPVACAPGTSKSTRPVVELVARLGAVIDQTLEAWPEKESLAPAIALLEKRLKHFRSMSQVRRGR